MPGPDPFGVEIEGDYPGPLTSYAHPSDATILGGGNKRHRIARARRILENVARGGWCCPWCLDFVPIYRRADAVYCSEGCRKRAARARR